MTTKRRITVWSLAAATTATLVIVVPRVVDAQEATGYDGYIQSGTCAAPTDDLQVKLKSQGEHDVKPYVAQQDGGGEIVLGYYGGATVPGFGLAAIYTDEHFSLVITDTDSGNPVACGDMLEPDADRFGEAGTALVQLLPVGSSTVQGVAVIRRTELQRELDITPTQVRILLSTDVQVSATSQPAAGFDGYVQSGTCSSATNRVRAQLKGRGEFDVDPYLALSDASPEPLTLAYYGAPLATGYSLGTTYTDTQFSMVISDAAENPMACGDILEPDSDDFAEAGTQLVQLLPVGGTGTVGYALLERMPLERELDITPTRASIVIFAAPATSA